MNFLDLALILRMGCICGKEALTINNRRFFIRSRLAEGGFSVIDLVEDARTKKLYALKRITCHGPEDEQVAEREIQVMKTFKHSNIVPVIENASAVVGRHVQTQEPIREVLIVMPFYRNGSLQDRIDALQKSGENMSEATIWKMFLSICHTLKQLHNHTPSYAHRDLKPGNIMINDTGEPVLLDLGSAAQGRVEVKNRSQAQTLQDEAAERCSMLFRPPELFNVEPGMTIDERTDIWSLGCVLYAMAYKQSPFESVYQRGDSIALAVVGRNIHFPENTPYSSSIEEVVNQCMSVNLVERPFIETIIESVEPLVRQYSGSS